jgi:hypothetical protein
LTVTCLSMKVSTDSNKFCCPFMMYDLVKQLTPGRDIQLFKAVERPSRRFLAANKLDFYTVSEVKQELISPKLYSKVCCMEIHGQLAVITS